MEVRQLALLAWPLVSVGCYQGWWEGRESVEQVDSVGRMTLEEEERDKVRGKNGKGRTEWERERESSLSSCKVETWPSWSIVQG